MKSIKGTRTELNLLASFAGESQAIMRYTIWGKLAAKDGYQQISAIFAETAYNEQAHAKLFFSHLIGGMLPVGGNYPAGIMSTTLDNLKEAAENDHDEHSVIYPGFAKIAEEEGFTELADLWNNVAIAEGWHEERFRGFFNDVKAARVFKRAKPVRWVCRRCGCTLEGDEAPQVCPCCQHPMAYFEIGHDIWR